KGHVVVGEEYLIAFLDRLISHGCLPCLQVWPVRAPAFAGVRSVTEMTRFLVAVRRCQPPLPSAASLCAWGPLRSGTNASSLASHGADYVMRYLAIMPGSSSRPNPGAEDRVTAPSTMGGRLTHMCCQIGSRSGSAKHSMHRP